MCGKDLRTVCCENENASTEAVILRGRHRTEPRHHIVIHGNFAEERNARPLRLGAEHFVRRKAKQSHYLIEGIFQCGLGKPRPEVH
jgi:hypothetical protein